MNIEFRNAQQESRSVAGTSHSGGKKSGKLDLPGSAASNGFSALLSSLQAQEPAAGVDVAGDQSGLLVAQSSAIPSNCVSDFSLPVTGSMLQSVPDFSTAIQSPLTNLSQVAVDTASAVLTNLSIGDSMKLPLGAKNKASLPTVGEVSIKDSVTMQVGNTSKAEKTMLWDQFPELPVTNAAVEPSIAATSIQTSFEPVLVSQSTPQLETLNPITVSQMPKQSVQESLVKPQSDAPLGSKNKPQLTALNAMQFEAGQEKTSFVMSQAPAQPVLDGSNKSWVEAFAVPKNPLHSQANAATQVELRDSKAAIVLSQPVVPQDIAAAVVASGVGDAWVRPIERSGSKSAGGQSGVGFDGVFGQAVAGNPNARNDFAVTEPSAIVPDTKIAETVSYWVTHGVQTAELKLDGFGGDPVEVSISLHGDQAQIEFRTDQVDVRQALEGATAHLKDLLSSEGLQLTGVWVGASGSGNQQGDDSEQRPGAKNTAFVQSPVVTPTSSRIANLSVGQSLDVFV
jgi:flagellar hook-length control protein FliK